MAKNPLLDLIDSRGRKVSSYDPSEELLSTRTTPGGNYGITVQQTPKTNSLTSFVEGFNNLRNTYSSIVKQQQNKAEIDIAKMDDEEFDKHYNELLEKKGVKTIFGYNKAFQEKLVERAYNEEFPTALLEFKDQFRKNIQNYNNVSEFDDAIEVETEKFMDEWGSRFNSNEFAQGAHNLLSAGRKAKIKVGLHAEYEAEAKKFIVGQEVDDLALKLDETTEQTNYSKFFSGKYDNILQTLDGDKAKANEIIISGVKQHAYNLLNDNSQKSLERLQDLFEEVFVNDDTLDDINKQTGLLVGNKEIFNTSAGIALESELRAKIIEKELNLPQLQATQATNLLNDFKADYYRNEGDTQAQSDLLEQFEDSILEQKDDGVLVLLQEGLDKFKDSPQFDRSAVSRKFAEGLPSANYKFDTNQVGSIISQMYGDDKDFKAFELFYDGAGYGADPSKVAPLPIVDNLAGQYRQYYNLALYELVDDFYLDPKNNGLSVDQLTEMGIEAQSKARETATDRLRSNIRSYVETALKSPIDDEGSKSEISSALTELENLGLDEEAERLRNTYSINPEKVLNDARALVRQSKELLVADLGDFNDDKQFKIHTKGKKLEVVDRFAKTLELKDFYKSPSDIIANYNEVIKKWTKSGLDDTERSRIYKSIDTPSTKRAGLEELWSYIEVRGISDGEIINGYHRGYTQSTFLGIPDFGVYNDDYWKRRPEEKSGTLFEQRVEGSITDSRVTERHVDVDIIDLLSVDSDVAERGEITQLNEFPILINGNLGLSINAINNNNVEAYEKVANALTEQNIYDVTAEDVFNFQKEYFTALGYIQKPKKDN
jgi:hypothetical protein